jgi:PRTRC genetic system protein B
MTHYLKPEKAIILYNRGTSSYAEVHNINEKGDFEAGRPFQADEIKAFSIIADSEKSLHEKKCLPHRLILGFESDVISDKIAWIYPAGKVHLQINAYGLTSGEYYIPNIVFLSDGKSITVYAIKKKDVFNIGKDTQLYHAPFMNVYSGGNVCMGSAKIKKFQNINEMIHSVERAFFDSTFTHTNHNNIVKGGIIECFNNQKRSFDEKVLIPSIKLNELWK